jgi:photosystem II stability/assembly factor-like uncharacterized protein
MVQDQYHPLWGVYKSPDGGQTWNAVNGSDGNVLPAGFGVLALAIDPVTSALYAGLGGYWGGSGGGGVYKSTDGGLNWINTGLPPNMGVQALAIDPANRLTLYAGTDVGGVFMSSDGGVTWSSITADPLLLNVYTLAIAAASSSSFAANDPVTSSTLYAGAYVGGVFKTSNGGVTWSAVNNGLPTDAVITALAIDSMNPGTLYTGKGTPWGTSGGVFKSIDGGNSWRDITAGLPTDFSIHALAIDPWTPGTLYAGSFGGGIFVSPDGGSSWNGFNTGLTDGQVHAFATNPATPIYAGTCTYGVFVLQ